MIPRLFKEYIATYPTPGELSEAILSDSTVCTVTEKRNGCYELHIEVPAKDEYVKFIRPGWLAEAKPNAYSTDQLFDVYHTEVSSGVMTIEARHVWYRLTTMPCDIIPTSTYTSTLMSNVASKTYKVGNSFKWHDFTFTGSQDQSALSGAEFYTDRIMNTKDVLLEACDYFDADLRIDNWSLYMKSPSVGSDTNVVVGYGKNIISFDYIRDNEESYNGVCPYYSASDKTTVMLGSTTDANQKAYFEGNGFQYPKFKLLDVTSQYTSAPTLATLKSMSQNTHGMVSDEPTTSLSVKIAVEGNEFDNVKLCDTVMLVHPAIGLNQRIRVTGYEFDVLRERYNSINLGDDIGSLDSTLLQQERMSKTYKRNVKASNWFDFTFTRCGNWVTVSQTGNTVLPFETAARSFGGKWIPYGYRPMYDSYVTATATSGDTVSHCDYIFKANGEVWFWSALNGNGERSFTLSYVTNDTFPRGEG